MVKPAVSGRITKADLVACNLLRMRHVRRLTAVLLLLLLCCRISAV
jgi:hypothetical protein